MKGLLIGILVFLGLNIVFNIVSSVVTKREEKYVRELLALMNEEKNGKRT